MSDHFPPDDDLGPEMTPEEAFTRVMRIKLQRNREARAALKASEKSAQPGEPSETPVTRRRHCPLHGRASIGWLGQHNLAP